jgi:hypothetical protein
VSSISPARRKQTANREGTGFTLKKQLSDASIDVEALEAPRLWHDEEELSPHSSSIPEISFRSSHTHNNLHRRCGTTGHGESSFSRLLDEEYSVYHGDYDERKLKPFFLYCRPRLFTAINFWQLLALFAFGIVIYDSRYKLHHHRKQLQQYDEERAHILEQMTWIDNAAKKVHRKYSRQDLLLENLSGEHATLEQETKEQLLQETVLVREELEKLQLKIQANARSRIRGRFGDSPVQVSLALPPDGNEHLVIALSDDTPHAASTFLEQVELNMWDELDVQRLHHGSILRLSSKIPSTTPVLEFVEKSRGCHTAGSVALHQLDSAEFHSLVLRIHTEDHIRQLEGDVCIGQVIRGLETLQELAPQVLVGEERRLDDADSNLET